MSTEPNTPQPDRILPALLLSVPFAGVFVAHFAFVIGLPALGLIALLCLVIGGLYHLLWKPGEKRPGELAALFIIGEAFGVATLVLAFLRLFIK